jgi:uncharacterized membrane protein YccC
MGHAVPLAVAAALIFSLATIPAFIVIEVLMPLASGFPVFALAVAPMLFLCALLMANERTMLIGFMSALLFASVGAFQNRMVYDPISLVNTAIAAVFAAALAMVLWAVLAPETPRAVRRRFARAARTALAPCIATKDPPALDSFESAMGGALVQFRTGLAPNREDDASSLEAGIMLLGAGRELILSAADRRLPPRRTAATGRFYVPDPRRLVLPYLRSSMHAAISRCLHALERDRFDAAALRVSGREIARIEAELARASFLPVKVYRSEALQHVA